MSERARLFPQGCTCLSYGRGLTETRVNTQTCPVHGNAAVSRANDFLIDGKLYRGGLLFPELEHLRRGGAV